MQYKKSLYMRILITIKGIVTKKEKTPHKAWSWEISYLKSL